MGTEVGSSKRRPRAGYTRLALPALEAALALRALLFLGMRFVCPCCGWRLRAFTRGGTSLRVRPSGYCPRCNSKARHRRDWLYLEKKTDLFSKPIRLFHVSPKYSLSRRFVKMANLRYVAADIFERINLSLRMDLTATPIRCGTFDAAICIHVLEHILEDRRAISELYRVLKPGGWALISVPVRLNRPTFEDPSITAPAERRRAFGEASHVRIYGLDLAARLEECGFRVEMDLARDLDKQTVSKYGLTDDENVFYCSKI